MGLKTVEVFNEQGAKNAHLPPLEQMLAKMGKPGELALSARKQRGALLRQNTTDQIGDQTLFAGQEAGIYTPVRAEEGPWTERIPGMAYLRFKINGGNLASDKVMEVRILAPRGAVASARTAHLVYTSFLSDRPGELVPTAYPQATTAGSPPPQNLIQLSIGYAVGQGAQGLIPTPPPPQCPAGQQVIAPNLQKPQTSFPPRYA